MWPEHGKVDLAVSLSQNIMHPWLRNVHFVSPTKHKHAQIIPLVGSTRLPYGAISPIE